MVTIPTEYLFDTEDYPEGGLTFVASTEEHRRFGAFWTTYVYKDEEGQFWGATCLRDDEYGVSDTMWKVNEAGDVIMEELVRKEEVVYTYSYIKE